MLEVFALIRCADWSEFLAVKEDLNLRIVEIVRGLPGRISRSRRRPCISAATEASTRRGARRSRARSRSGGEQSRYPFPEFDYAERARDGWTPFPSRPRDRPTTGRSRWRRKDHKGPAAIGSRDRACRHCSGDSRNARPSSPRRCGARPTSSPHVPTLASTSARRKRSITSMKRIEGSSRISAVIEAIW